jgi:hypothetical protein
MKSALPLMAAVLFGFVLGAFSHLSLVKAASNTGPVNIQKVSDDVNNGSIRGSEFLGFACTPGRLLHSESLVEAVCEWITPEVAV